MTGGVVTRTLRHRFWAKVALPDENGCMLWLASIDPINRYGQFTIGKKSLNAHRVALMLTEGSPVSPRTVAAHSCRNRHCVAPRHLRWATKAENSADMIRDGSSCRGERNWSAKLTSDQVRTIRTCYAAGGVSKSQLARDYGVRLSAIGKILDGTTWAIESAGIDIVLALLSPEETK